MPCIREMSVEDLAAATHLSESVGWNQVEADWRRLLRIEPEGCFVADSDLGVVGTVTACTFETVAWVAMVLVAPEARGRGAGTQLARHAVEWLEGKGVTSIRLDATAAGMPIYKRLGFVEQYELARYEGVLVPDTESYKAAGPVSADEWEDLVELDRRITMTSRAKWLTGLFADWPEAVRVVRKGGEIVGFMAARRGARAVQLGPCLCLTPEAGAQLLQDASHHYGGSVVYLDVPLVNLSAVQNVERMGLRVQRSFVRMCRGVLVKEDTARLWLSSGPEMG